MEAASLNLEEGYFFGNNFISHDGTRLNELNETNLGMALDFLNFPCFPNYDFVAFGCSPVEHGPCLQEI